MTLSAISVAAQNREVGQEDVGSQIVYETGNLESYLTGFVRNHVEAVVIPLKPELVLGGRAELVVPGALQVVVVVVDRAARGEGRSEIARPDFAPGRVRYR